MTDLTTLSTRVHDQFPRLLDDLKDLVRIDSVSAPAFDQQRVYDSAEAVATLVRELGMDDVRVVTAGGSRPAVLASRPAAPGYPTVLLYAHHDVQPPGADAEWNTPPFEPTQVGERLYGRGAADDKAGIVAHIGALRAVGDDLNVGVTLFIEGEEEIGSPGFTDFLTQYRDDLRADVIVVADSANWKVGVPALTTSLRGLVDCVVEVCVLNYAVHSGMFGGPILDALTVTSRIIASLHDDHGNVAVAGLVTGEEPAVDYAEADFRADSGLVESAELMGTGSIAGRLWTKPAISVIGIDAPSVDESSNTLIPRTRVKFRCGLPPAKILPMRSRRCVLMWSLMHPLVQWSVCTTARWGKPSWLLRIHRRCGQPAKHLPMRGAQNRWTSVLVGPFRSLRTCWRCTLMLPFL